MDEKTLQSVADEFITNHIDSIKAPVGVGYNTDTMPRTPIIVIFGDQIKGLPKEFKSVDVVYADKGCADDLVEDYSGEFNQTIEIEVRGE